MTINKPHFLSTIFLLFIGLICFFEAKSENNLYNRAYLLIKDTIPKEIPLTKGGTPISDYVYKKKFEKLLNLEEIENGFDSIEIRIWLTYSFIDSCQLIILQNRYGKWSCRLYNFIYEYDPKVDRFMDSIKLVKVICERKNPNSGWNSFIDNLYKFNILSLPDHSAIPGYAPFTDGNSITIEFSTLSKYRILGYQLPFLLPVQHIPIKNVLSIIELFEKELGFKSLRPTSE